jgi:hypothetical protein
VFRLPTVLLKLLRFLSPLAFRDGSLGAPSDIVGKRAALILSNSCAGSSLSFRHLAGGLALISFPVRRSLGMTLLALFEFLAEFVALSFCALPFIPPAGFGDAAFGVLRGFSFSLGFDLDLLRLALPFAIRVFLDAVCAGPGVELVLQLLHKAGGVSPLIVFRHSPAPPCVARPIRRSAQPRPRNAEPGRLAGHVLAVASLRV